MQKPEKTEITLPIGPVGRRKMQTGFPAAATRDTRLFLLRPDVTMYAMEDRDLKISGLETFVTFAIQVNCMFYHKPNRIK